MGGLKKTKTEGGSGGKRGHSNMMHWAFTEEVKKAAKTQRRIEDKKLSREADNEHSLKKLSRNTKKKSGREK